jgi:hypothetical protein
MHTYHLKRRKEPLWLLFMRSSLTRSSKIDPHILLLTPFRRYQALCTSSKFSSLKNKLFQRIKTQMKIVPKGDLSLKKMCPRIGEVLLTDGCSYRRSVHRAHPSHPRSSSVCKLSLPAVAGHHALPLLAPPRAPPLRAPTATPSVAHQPPCGPASTSARPASTHASLAAVRRRYALPLLAVCRRTLRPAAASSRRPRRDPVPVAGCLCSSVSKWHAAPVTPDLPPNGLRRGGLVASELDSSTVVPPLSVQMTILWGILSTVHTVSRSVTCVTCFCCASTCKVIQWFCVYDTERLHQCYMRVPITLDQ